MKPKVKFDSVLEKVDQLSDEEQEMLRSSHAFQKFLDDRSMCKRRIPLEEIEKEIEKELSEKENTA